MARFGHIFMVGESEEIDGSKKWMQDYDYAEIIEEMTEVKLNHGKFSGQLCKRKDKE